MRQRPFLYCYSRKNGGENNDSNGENVLSKKNRMAKNRKKVDKRRVTGARNPQAGKGGREMSKALQIYMADYMSDRCAPLN